MYRIPKHGLTVGGAGVLPCVRWGFSQPTGRRCNTGSEAAGYPGPAGFAVAAQFSCKPKDCV
ncbi:MAG: hypothetical protein CMJ75_20510 [Planctomycetaceae bacterium]|nr:hypothetical protein [Planctomycetaceae bacterium]